MTAAKVLEMARAQGMCWLVQKRDGAWEFRSSEGYGADTIRYCPLSAISIGLYVLDALTSGATLESLGLEVGE